jgi:membrane associated rhomboid family serine protease
VGLIIWVVLVGILAPIVYSLLRKWYVSLAIAISCAITTLLFFLAIDGFVPSDMVGDDYLGMVFSPVYLSGGAHLEGLFVSIFVHANLMHIAFNVIGLMMFGMMLEERVGGPRALFVFLFGALAGELFFSLFNWEAGVLLVGASGGIMAMVGGFARLYPYEKVSIFGLFVILRNAPAWKMALIFVSIDLVLALITTGASISGFMGNVAYLAHVGGLLAGFLIAPLVMRADIKERVEEIDVDAVKRIVADGKAYADIESAVKGEREKEVVDAWLARIEELARCPKCEGKLKLDGSNLVCKKGHSVKVAK